MIFIKFFIAAGVAMIAASPFMFLGLYFDTGWLGAVGVLAALMAAYKVWQEMY